MVRSPEVSVVLQALLTTVHLLMGENDLLLVIPQISRVLHCVWQQ